ncbi:MAG: hypothetical protein O7D88_07625 [Gammaproteobacteria bacterium]|nr:hypothetical protein [Planctomycetota bacterium]MCZ6827353.1 hypothetical protein [Gammaproteobacteria bacterium]
MGTLAAWAWEILRNKLKMSADEIHVLTDELAEVVFGTRQHIPELGVDCARFPGEDDFIAQQEFVPEGKPELNNLAHYFLLAVLAKNPSQEVRQARLAIPSAHSEAHETAWGYVEQLYYRFAGPHANTRGQPYATHTIIALLAVLALLAQRHVRIPAKLNTDSGRT